MTKKAKAEIIELPDIKIISNLPLSADRLISNTLIFNFLNFNC
jgi:hypothetical protein